MSEKNNIGERIVRLEEKHNHHDSRISTIEESLKNLAVSLRDIQLTLAKFFGKQAVVIAICLVFLPPIIGVIVNKLFN